MPETRPTICITCGQALGEVPELHRLSDGSPCPSCRDRLLETLPALLPGSPEPVAQGEDDLVERDPGADVAQEDASATHDADERASGSD